ncbi:hypothetical protein CH63R_11549 [Colletotrichum higginsianum IMI 349063]|uniref:Uncharacterized protein n=3 Tax=Colletotrichum higginsianum TaxID=80884 RepID=A0A1B7XYL2_COLHI|nr:hypothetical protein CH63R_11549 [Colletotrichum higginsianum IMI 349063]OBR04846.1 hypothetical protein CH63R_11549 [Colletotrichum higginsianum IMI 349063]TIC93905.1 hypothetical protein CH35J_009267 [Colletotrichum higginsianum]GJC99487.1 hypothetical protein ColKHC_08313 [Colletotrichum higginsianum]
MSPADADARRRERGVIAQREYRKRHASKVQSLQDENQKLKDIIAEIDRASHGRRALPDDLRAALFKARDLAGISDDGIGEQEEDAHTDEVEQVAAGPLLPEQPAHTPAASTAVVRRATTLEIKFPPDYQPPPDERFSPRLDYGLWFETDRVIRILDPPTDIVPYLGAGMHTLAGSIFWSTMDYTLDLWNSRSAPPAARLLDRMFSQSRHVVDTGYLLSLAQARVDFMRKGFMFRKLSEQFERNAMVDLQRLISEHNKSRGLPSKYWKKPEEVAWNVLSQLTPGQATRFQAVIEGKGAPADEEMMRSMITWLAQNYVCFGDGPRWSNISISVGIGSWVKGVNDADAGVLDASKLSAEMLS